MAVFRIDKTKDYTVMSNCHLRDKRLTLKAKGLLSQMLSLPEDWDYTLTGLSQINRESKDAIRTAVNELERAGYVERRQTTDDRGKFSVNEYIIHESPMEQPSSAYPSSENPTTENPSTGNPSSENPTQLNTKKSKTEKQNKERSITQSFLPSEAPAGDGRKDGAELREEVQEQIEYDYLLLDCDPKQVDELVEIMVEVRLNRNPTIKIGREAEYPAAYVQERFSRIGPEHIRKVLKGLEENTTRVYNTRAYLLSTLFNSVSTLENHYAMLVNHDFHG